VNARLHLPAEPLPDARDLALVAAIQDGLPLCERPWARIGERLGMSEAEVLARVRAMVARGEIRRMGVVVRHRELGYRANAMVVWNVPDERVATLGQRLGGEPCVTLCYRRPRRPPRWPYNLFTMIHGRDRTRVLACLDELIARHDLRDIPHEVLFSRHRYKQCGARYAASPAGNAAGHPTPAEAPS